MEPNANAILDWMSKHRGHGKYYTNTNIENGDTLINCACGASLDAGRIRTLSPEGLRRFNEWLASPTADVVEPAASVKD